MLIDGISEYSASNLYLNGNVDINARINLKKCKNKNDLEYKNVWTVANNLYPDDPAEIDEVTLHKNFLCGPQKVDIANVSQSICVFSVFICNVFSFPFARSKLPFVAIYIYQRNMYHR